MARLVKAGGAPFGNGTLNITKDTGPESYGTDSYLIRFECHGFQIIFLSRPTSELKIIEHTKIYGLSTGEEITFAKDFFTDVNQIMHDFRSYVDVQQAYEEFSI